MANETSNAGNKAVQAITGLTKDTLEKITQNLTKTLFMGFLAGSVGILGYALSLPEGSRAKLFFILVLIAGASYICGFFLGFLFGIPKRNNNNESDYNLSTNLVDISDWLTKIIIGLGLIEIKKIPEYLLSLGTYIQQTVSGENSVKIFSICCIVYFSVFGLYYGYNYMRLFLSGQFKEADDNLLRNKQKLNETGEALKEQNIDPTSEIDESMKKNLATYDELLKSTKTEEDYIFEDWYYKGVTAYDEAKYNQCIAYMQNALAKDSKAKNAPDAYLYMGLCYDALSLRDQALEQYDYIIKNYKNYGYMYIVNYDKGLLLNDIGNYEEALLNFNRTIEIMPDYTNAWIAKGNSLIAMNKYEDAMQAIDQAIATDPNNSTAWGNKGFTLISMGKYDEALKSLDKALLSNSNNSNALANKGFALIQLGKYEDALQNIDKALLLDNNNSNTWGDKALALINMEKYDEALTATNRSIQLNANDEKAWNNKGMVLIRLGKLDEAMQALDEALRLHPEYALSCFNKAAVYALKNDKEKMLLYLQKAINLMPSLLNTTTTDNDFAGFRDDEDFKKLVGIAQ